MMPDIPEPNVDKYFPEWFEWWHILLYLAVLIALMPIVYMVGLWAKYGSIDASRSGPFRRGFDAGVLGDGAEAPHDLKFADRTKWERGYARGHSRRDRYVFIEPRKGR